MKKALLSIIAVISIASCSKKDVDSRDQFAGTYKCTQTNVNQSKTTTSTYTRTVTSDGSYLSFRNASGVLMVVAKLNGSSYAYEEQNVGFGESGSSDTDGRYQSGTGSINGNIITEQGTFGGWGGSVYGTYSTIMEKQ